MLLRILFLICFPVLLLTGAQESAYTDNFSMAPKPAWVKPSDIPLDAKTAKPTENVQYLLMDIQRNWEEQTVFRHSVMKALTQTGMRDISELHIDFEPSFQTLILHNIRVYRDGEWSERMETSQHQVIQKEEELNNGVYSGSLSVVYFLDDIRMGDILE